MERYQIGNLFLSGLPCRDRKALIRAGQVRAIGSRMEAMRSTNRSRETFAKRLISLLLGGCLLPGGSALAEEDHRALFVRPQAASAERRVREMPGYAPDFLRNQAQDESRATPRHWSPEERQQLRRDIHEAGRDVYGSHPRRE
jgi:hypothetical protein